MLTAGTLIQIPACATIPVEDVARGALALVGAEGVVALMLAGIWRLKFRTFLRIKKTILKGSMGSCCPCVYILKGLDCGDVYFSRGRLAKQSPTRGEGLAMQLRTP
jgi:hypothetical protein